MRMAFFNWRDIRHPMAGGAEVMMHQLLRRLSSQGHEVALFTSAYKGAKTLETIDGIRHIRYGGRFSMYLGAFHVYKKHIQGRYDVIIESINGVPFFTPLFAKERVVAFIHQLTRENWYSSLPYPIAFMGFHAEDFLLSLYRSRLAIVPSESTKKDLLSLGFKDIRIVNEAAEIDAPAGMKKEAAPTLIYLGRLTKSKRVDHALRCLRIIKDSAISKGWAGKPRLWIVGSGSQEEELKSLAQKLGLSQDIVFFGKVDENRKAELLSKAHISIFPAVREGWGLVVLEANSCGTPVLGYDVPGLRDSIVDGENGFILPSGDIEGMAKKAISLLEDPDFLDSISRSSTAYSKKFSWKRCADEFIQSLESR
jgi:glycosyltransferase involved in cell wall biosynthesis